MLDEIPTTFGQDWAGIMGPGVDASLSTEVASDLILNNALIIAKKKVRNTGASFAYSSCVHETSCYN
jgi:hypothetical protein